jgi:hypothetical protein
VQENLGSSGVKRSEERSREVEVEKVGCVGGTGRRRWRKGG